MLYLILYTPFLVLLQSYANFIFYFLIRTRYGDRVNSKIERSAKADSLELPPDELSNSNLFKMNTEDEEDN
jgi:hypothetical protein